MEFIKRTPRIYVLTGKAGNGKNKLASTISDIYNENNITSINLSYASYLKEYAKNIVNWNGSEEDKPREFLQKLGIDLIKNKINATMLIDRLVDDIKVYSYFYDVITISDARFIEEIEVIKNKFNNVVVIHIYGKEYNKLTTEERNHITEVALDDYKNYDYEIENNKTVLELKEKMKRIISEVENYE